MEFTIAVCCTQIPKKGSCQQISDECLNNYTGKESETSGIGNPFLLRASRRDNTRMYQKKTGSTRGSNRRIWLSIISSHPASHLLGGCLRLQLSVDPAGSWVDIQS